MDSDTKTIKELDRMIATSSRCVKVKSGRIKGYVRDRV